MRTGGVDFVEYFVRPRADHLLMQGAVHACTCTALFN